MCSDCDKPKSDKPRSDEELERGAKLFGTVGDVLNHKNEIAKGNACKVCGLPAFRPGGEFCSRECFQLNMRRGREERDERDAKLKLLFERAHEAGLAAGNAAVPVPMVVEQHQNMADDSSPVAKRYVVPSGVCGFAWVTIYPGTSAAARYAKKNLGARKGYHGGMEIWISLYGQSMELKEAYAEAYAEVIRSGGFKAYAGSRMD